MIEEFMQEQEEREAFTIDDDKKAEWAIKRIKAAREERDRLMQLVEVERQELQAHIESIEKGYERDTAYLTQLLRQYASTRPLKETKTTATYKLLTGTLKFTRGGYEYKRDEEALTAWAKANHPEYVKVKESTDWAGLKKVTVTAEDGSVIDEDGQIVEGVTATKKDDTFTVNI